MSSMEIISKIAELKELEAMAAELKAEMESIKDELKGELIAQDVDTLTVGTHTIRYVPVLSQRFDSTQLKRKLPEVYVAYLRQVQSFRFSIS